MFSSCASGEGGNSLIMVCTYVLAWAIGFSGINFCPGIRFLEVNFARAGFMATLD